MQFQLTDSIDKVPGIGPATANRLKKYGVEQLLDLLLLVPLRYEDRSHIRNIDQLEIGQVQTVKATVESIKEHFKITGKRKLRISNARISDQSGSCHCLWFNHRFIKQNLQIGEEYFFAGQFNQFRTFSQPVVEKVSDQTAHTGRLVPIYSQLANLKQGNLRRWLKTATDHLAVNEDKIAREWELLNITRSIQQLHFPEDTQLIIQARERLAIEELLALMMKSKSIKNAWQKRQALANLATHLSPLLNQPQLAVPSSVPYTLTDEQLVALDEILHDLAQSHPMNRLLVGDVGTGKTVVAGVACWQIAQAGWHSALIAPTQILANQHLNTINQLFPTLPTQLLTAKTSSRTDSIRLQTDQPTLFIGTQSVINKLDQIRPGLIVFDEQHRFGVNQRSLAKDNPSENPPHLLTMSATPIPRSYMLTIFSHLDLSVIKKAPFGKKQVQSWYVPKIKHKQAYEWFASQLESLPQPRLGIIVCPFIEPTSSPELADIPAASVVFEQLQKQWGSKLNIGLLHGQQKPPVQTQVINQLYDNKLDLLVTTSVVEVGVDLPQANLMIIEGAERFGLASLHQLRGRLGRLGQKAYCLLSSSTRDPIAATRLRLFAKENDGFVLAEQDLANRGPGDLFGLDQHGFLDLRFASWGNADLIKKAQDILEWLQKELPSWQPTFSPNIKFPQDHDHLSSFN